MSKLLKFLLFFIFISGCSFDNKTGIWDGQKKLLKIMLKN